MRCEWPSKWFFSSRKNKPAILLAESDPQTATAVVALLEGTGADIVTVRHGSEAVGMCRRGKHRIILAAADLPDFDAVSFMRAAGKNRNLVLMLKNGQGMAGRADFIRQGAYDVIGKPIDPQTFPLAIRRALAKRALQLKVDFLKGLTVALIAIIPLVMTAGILLAVN